VKIASYCGVLLMKNTALVLALIFILLFLVVGVFFVNLVKGNAVFPSGSIDIETKPVYYSSTINLSYLAVFPMDFGDGGLGRKWIVYSLDGGGNVTVYDEYNDLESYYGSLTLSGLSSGWHTIDIYSMNGTFLWGTSSFRDWRDSHDRDIFTVDLSGKSPAPTSTPAPTSVPTFTPGPTSTPSNELQLARQEAILGVVVTVAVLAVSLGLPVYLIKRK
jgi:hypothetical protein